MLFYLVLFCLASQVLSFNCPYDGKFVNPDNRISYIKCVDRIDTIVNCPETGFGTRHWSLVFNGRDCVEPWECPEIGGTYKNTKNGHVYFMCMDGEPAQYSCPYGTRFDGRGCESSSDWPLEHGSFICPFDGIFNNRLSRTSYIQCIDNRPYVRFCRQFTDSNTTWSLVFDGEKCVQPFECPEINGIFRRDSNGKTHFKCKDGVPEEYHCLNDTQFDGRYCRPKSESQGGIRPRPPHFRILIKNRDLVKFEFDNRVITDTFDQLTFRWNRLVEFNDIV